VQKLSADDSARRHPSIGTLAPVGREWPLLAELPDDDRRRVLALTRRRRFGRHEVVFHEGDPGDTLHLIDSGHIAIRTTTAGGDVATFTVLGPGDCFGEQALLSPRARRTGSAVAVEGAETLSLPRDEFKTLREERPSVDRFLVEVLATQVRRLSTHLLEALYEPVETRVARRLVALSDAYANDEDDSVTIPLTQDDLATMAGVARPTANRVLRALAADHIVEVRRGSITVLDSDTLARRAR
jgi:CRP-like cAMP-binding protein